MENNKLKQNFKKLEEIVKWFDQQKEIDLEVGLSKIKEGGKLIKESKHQLQGLENEFEEVKKEMNKEI
ncbi:exodeoxyribonuclease VII small subunit [Patescibacteria group bacterium]|nr:exodeoxyribonuclease VII small subunit [Patescibacteria group bacterium]